MPNDALSVQQFAQTLKQRDPRLAMVPDEVLVKKALGIRPELMRFLASPPARPGDPMKNVMGYDVMGPIRDTGYHQIGERIKQNFTPSNIPAAISDTEARFKSGQNQWPAIFQALQQYGKPENVIGDVISAWILGKAGGVPERIPRPAAAATESFEDMMTRRGPGEKPTGPSLNEQRSLVENMRMRFERMRASGDPGMWNQATRLREAEDALKAMEKAQWPANYQAGPKTVSSQGGAGANYSAADLEAFKKKWNIQ